VASSGSSVYLTFIKEQVAAQDARKASLEQRGIAVITTSGTLASLLLAFAALVTASKDFALSACAHDFVVAATIAFALAAVAAVLTNIPVLYAGVNVEQMRALLRDKWADEQATAEQRTAATLVNVIASAKERNRVKGWVLFAAMAIETVAVVLLTIAAAVILV
jgi:hypothetical protein